MKENEKKFRSVMLKIGITMLIFIVLFDITSTVYMIFSLFLPELVGEIGANVLTQLIYGFMYLASFMVSALILGAMCGKDIVKKPLERKIPVNSAVYIFAGIALMTAMAYINSFLFPFFNETQEVTESIRQSDNYTFILYFIVIAIVPAICEEFLFRGAIMHSLLKFGKVPAILISGVLFGLMHSNFSQFFYTTIGGIFLGWVACETGSIYCGMLIHFAQNFTSVMQSYIADRFREPQMSIVYYIMECLIFAVGIPCIIYLVVKFSKDLRRRRSVKDLNDGIYGITDEDIGALALPAGRVTRLFFSPTVIVFIVISVLLAFSSLILI